jgi:putative transposase
MEALPLHELIKQYKDHRGVKQRYYPMRGFGSLVSAARFCTAFSEIRHYFRPPLTMNRSPSLSEQRQNFCQRWTELLSIGMVS